MAQSIMPNAFNFVHILTNWIIESSLSSRNEVHCNFSEMFTTSPFLFVLCFTINLFHVEMDQYMDAHISC